MTQTPHVELDPQPAPRRGGVPRWAWWTVGGIVAAIALLYGGIFVYTEFIKDSPDAFDADDRDQRLEDAAAATDAPDATVETANPPVASTVAADPVSSTVVTGATTAAPTDVAAAGATTWTATEQSEVGYRVKEVLFGVDTEGVGRTNAVTGTLTIDGTTVTSTAFEVDVASITSDESRRDNQFRGRIMSTDEFPTASFTLTEPIELGSAAVDGAAVTTTATGELTLRGVTQPVTFDVDARMENGLIGVQGSIPVVFADYGIANPSTGGITTEDNGLVEFVLIFEQS